MSSPSKNIDKIDNIAFDRYLCNSFCFDVADMQPDVECLHACKQIYHIKKERKERKEGNPGNTGNTELNQKQLTNWEQVVIESVKQHKEKIMKRYEETGSFCYPYEG
jgi:hypothetical protein